MSFKWWRAIGELDDYQAAIIALPPDGNYLITGPPGSGKTNLLALRARYLIMAGRPNVVILTFTRSLTEFLRTGVGNYSLDPRVVRTYNSWARQLIREYDQTLDDDENFEQARANLLAALQELVRQYPNIEGAFDCILLDESQDYSAEEILTLKHLSKNIYAAADNDQRIWSGRDGLEALRTFSTEKTLPYNYRNAPDICRVADAIHNRLDTAGGLEATANYADRYAPSIEAIAASDLDEQIHNVLESVALQLRAYPGESIGILTLRNDVLNRIAAELEQSNLSGSFQLQSSLIKDRAIDDDRPVLAVTIHNAKGLEFRAVHLVAVEDIEGRNLARELAYTAVTRAKTSLTLHYSGTLPGFIAAALASLQAKAPPRDLGALFSEDR